MNREFWTIFKPRTKAYAFADGDDESNDDGNDDDGEEDEPEARPPRNNSNSSNNSDVNKILRDTRREAANYRTQLRAKESELSEAKKELDALRAEKRDRIIQEAVTAEAKKQGAIEPEILHRLGSWTLSDDGNTVVDVEKEVKALKEKHPKLFGTVAGANGGSGNGSGLKGESFSDRLKQAATRG